VAAVVLAIRCGSEFDAEPSLELWSSVPKGTSASLTSTTFSSFRRAQRAGCSMNGSASGPEFSYDEGNPVDHETGAVRDDPGRRLALAASGPGERVQKRPDLKR